MVFSDNNNSQVPEAPIQNQGTEIQKAQSVEAPISPAPVAPIQAKAKDDSAARKIAADLQNTTTQPQPVQPQAQASTKNPVNTKGSEPYIKAAERVIEQDKDDPYKEEEDHEDVQVKYLHDRFGKDIGKG